MSEASNTFKTMYPNFKEDYSDRFNYIKKLLKKGPKAKAEAEASRNPEKFMEQNKNPSIKHLKGVAF